MINPLSARYVASVPQPQGNQGWTDCFEWCTRYLTEPNHPRWHYIGEGVFEFDLESERDWFILRWT